MDGVPFVFLAEDVGDVVADLAEEVLVLLEGILDDGDDLGFLGGGDALTFLVDLGSAIHGGFIKI